MDLFLSYVLPLRGMYKIEFDIFAKPLKPVVLKFSKCQNPSNRFARFSD